MTNALGTWTYSYTGNSTTIADPLARKTTIGYAQEKNAHQYIPVATYITLYGDQKNEAKAKERASKKGVELFVIDFFDKK